MQIMPPAALTSPARTCCKSRPRRWILYLLRYHRRRRRRRRNQASSTKNRVGRVKEGESGFGGGRFLTIFISNRYVSAGALPPGPPRSRPQAAALSLLPGLTLSGAPKSSRRARIRNNSESNLATSNPMTPLVEEGRKQGREGGGVEALVLPLALHAFVVLSLIEPIFIDDFQTSKMIALGRAFQRSTD